ncbi:MULTISPECIES: GGDEF domain-containing protein [Vibrio]|uniref:GGDEF domain-containing protein n=1 Tax=Vibrio TaxID=662 RepID=UPI000BFF9E5E|nr:GGDEF domain-containing protein [Vibrio sp. PID17_43]PHJ42668.1 diguanylate cyclase [Vibrio sp. PID17_43]
MVKVVQRLLFLACCLLSLSLKSEPINPSHYQVATKADDVVTRVLFDAIAAKFNVSIQYVNYSSFGAALDSVAHGESDFAANITYTEARAQHFSYSRPTNIEYTYLYALHDATLDEVAIVGVPQGTIYAELIKQNYPELRQVPYQGHEEAVELLRSGRVDGVVDAINQLKPMLIEGFAAKMLNDYISIKPVSIVSKRGTYLEELDKFARFIHSEEVQKLLREQIALYQFELRQAALRKSIKQLPIDLNQPIRIKFESLFPYVIYQDDGSVKGLTADAVLQSCRILALNCEVVSQPNESWGTMYQQFIQGEFDILAPLIISRERREFSHFPQPHYWPTSVMVKRLGYKTNVYSDVSQLISERIGVVKDDFFDIMLTQRLPLKDLIRYQTQEDLVEALLAHEVDYIAMDTAMLNHFLRQSELIPIEKDNAIGEFYQSQLSIGLAKNERGELLTPFFSLAISLLDLGKIVATYDLRPDWRTALEYEVRLATQTRFLFFLLLIVAMGVSLYLYRQSNTDNLTGLRNRRSLQVTYRKGVQKDLTILYLDINKFKQINDTHGHRAGDEVLKLLSLKIRRVWEGRAYRIGGDEFILIGYPPKEQLARVIHELSLLNLEYAQFGELSQVTISVGVSEKRSRVVSLEQALHLADEDMYFSKQASRDYSLSHELAAQA